MGYVLMAFICLLPRVSLADQCGCVFSDEIRSEFVPGLVLNMRSLRVTWKSETFQMPMSEFLLVQLLVTSQVEVMSWDDLIIKYYGQTEERMIDAKATLKVIASKARARFRQVDPAFDEIQTKHGFGMYWARAEYKKHVMGRVVLSENFYEAWLDDQKIKMSQGEHYIMQKLFKAKKVNSFPELKARSVPVLICMLNQKFNELAYGDKLVINAGGGSYQLNPLLVD